MTLAARLGQSLNELMGWSGPMTHRQFVVWNAWLESEYNEPSRTDHYLMQLTTEVVRLRLKDSKIDLNKVQPEQYRIKFKRKSDRVEMTEEEKQKRISLAKSVWKARTGYKESRHE